jgi:hypothetical protein
MHNGASNWAFLGCHALNFAYSSTRPPKGTSLHQKTRFEPSAMAIGLAVRVVRKPKKKIKLKNEKINK